MNKKDFSTKTFSKIVWVNVLVILIATIVFGLAGALYAKHKQQTTYESVRDIMTTRAYKGDAANEEVQADMALGNTYAEIVESDDTAKAAHKYLPKNMRKKYDSAQISSMVHADPIVQTTIVKVSAKANSAHDSAAIVNAVTKASAKEIPQKVASAGKVSLFAKATAADAESNTSPSTKKLTLLGAAVGFLLGLVISFSATTWVYLIKRK